MTNIYQACEPTAKDSIRILRFQATSDPVIKKTLREVEKAAFYSNVSKFLLARDIERAVICPGSSESF
jgi:hypothetical protein